MYVYMNQILMVVPLTRHDTTRRGTGHGDTAPIDFKSPEKKSIWLNPPPPKTPNPKTLKKSETLWSRLVIPTGTKGCPPCAPCRAHVEALPSRVVDSRDERPPPLQSRPFSRGPKTGTKGPLDPRLKACFPLVTIQTMHGGCASAEQEQQ